MRNRAEQAYRRTLITPEGVDLNLRLADAWQRLGAFIIDLLVMVGDRDPGLDSAAMEHTFLAWHPNAELHVIRDCGHYPMQECPSYFAKIGRASCRERVLRLV